MLTNAAGLTRRLPVPNEPDQWVDVRLLSWRQIQEARDAQSTAALKRVSLLGADVTASLRAEAAARAKETTVEEEQTAPSDPLAEYDQRAVLLAGLVGWSYEAPVTPDNVDALDEETAKWAATEILGFKRKTEEERLAGFFRTGSGA